LALIESHLKDIFVSSAVALPQRVNKEGEWCQEEEILLRDYLMLLMHCTKSQGNAPVDRCPHQDLIYFYPLAGGFN
jgi:hypothetical protein